MTKEVVVKARDCYVLERLLNKLQLAQKVGDIEVKFVDWTKNEVELKLAKPEYMGWLENLVAVWNKYLGKGALEVI